jgi:hypothetical protein
LFVCLLFILCSHSNSTPCSIYYSHSLLFRFLIPYCCFRWSFIPIPVHFHCRYVPRSPFRSVIRFVLPICCYLFTLIPFVLPSLHIFVCLFPCIRSTLFTTGAGFVVWCCSFIRFVRVVPSLISLFILRFRSFPSYHFRSSWFHSFLNHFLLIHR